MEIRRLRPADLDAFYALRLQALRNDPSAFMVTLDEDLASGSARFLQTLSLAGPERIIAGGFASGELVGSAALFRGDKIKTLHSAKLAGMYVAPAARRARYGAAILDFLIAHARDPLGVSVIHLAVEAANLPAIRLYESRGFRTWGIKPRAMIAAGAIRDEARMYLLV